MISLKAYNQEIEQLIDNGLYDEAIAHCIHVLVSYPKCIDTYRNLGKSLLELKKYAEASDVFSRVLSAIPDDFISHVGLSIIFEDQNNLDLAIWHMEQAFDVQPSNLTIQDELKRLFGLRDGEQPAKIRLSRGALVRMYARGELFQQAITEILSILEEDPRRFDLEVILARMHYLSGSIDESAAICSQIIAKIPFCFEANRILQQININKKDSDAAAINKNRLVSLDPYYQFLPNPFSDQEVPENKVVLEKLQYIAAKSTASQIPAWLEDVEESKENKLVESLDWLGDLNNNIDTPTSNPVLNPFTTNENVTDNQLSNESFPSDDSLPDWIKTAGWNANLEPGLHDEKQSSNSQHLESQDLTSEAQSYEQPNEIKSEFGSKVTNEDLASLFTDLKEGKMENENLDSSTNDGKQFPPSDWMSQFSNSDGPVSSDSSDQDFPDWLKNFQAEEPQIIQNSDDMPDWLKNLQSEVEPNSKIVEDPLAEKAVEDNVLEETTFDNIFAEVEHEDETPSVDEPLKATSKQDDGWESIDLTSNISEESSESFVESLAPKVDEPQIESLDESAVSVKDLSESSFEPLESVYESVEPNDEPVESALESTERLDEPLESVNAFEKTVESSSISSDDKIPDWVKSVLIDQHSDEQETKSQEQDAQQDQTSNLFSQESIETDITSDEVEESEMEPDAGIISQQTNDELLDWLRGLKTEEEPSQQKEAEVNSVETPIDTFIQDESVIEPANELETKPEPERVTKEETLADILFPIEDIDLTILNLEQPNPIEENFELEQSPAEFETEPVMEQEEQTILESDINEFPDESIKPLAVEEPVEKIQTSELHLDTIFENQEANSIEELISKGDFDALSNAVSKDIAQGQDFDQILAPITAAQNEHGNNFSYWQCLGDIYSKNNHLNDALQAYQKAEDILIKTISS